MERQRKYQVPTVTAGKQSFKQPLANGLNSREMQRYQNDMIMNPEMTTTQNKGELSMEIGKYSRGQEGRQ